MSFLSLVFRLPFQERMDEDPRKVAALGVAAIAVGFVFAMNSNSERVLWDIALTVLSKAIAIFGVLHVLDAQEHGLFHARPQGMIH